MFTISVRNVHEALPHACHLMRNQGVRNSSRNGDVLVLPVPLATSYQNPMENVVFWPERDANPFFHFMESLWMLAGRNDVEFVRRFNSKIGDYSDNGETFHAAYGHRWRIHFGKDQLVKIIKALRQNPECRRQVLTMWSPYTDLGKEGKDFPCNTHAYFQQLDGKLNMMVCNRSNDLIWGAYGANAVHFSFLHKFMAEACGFELGKYHQVSMNTHLYLDPHEELMNTLADKQPVVPPPGGANPYLWVEPIDKLMTHGDYATWLADVELFVQEGDALICRNDFFHEVAQPMIRAYEFFKEKRFEKAYERASEIQAEDWKTACTQWMKRREAKWLAKNAK